ncbi:MAG: zeta toxin family protein, partial [Rickettsiales bacterium]|nr:zeta toxin family protein [Rickettsiales bacterium]
EIFKIFERFWEENCLEYSTSSAPELHIVGAQPGAGKTALVSKIGKEKNILTLIGDIYRTLHPNYRNILNSDRYSEFTGPLNGYLSMLVVSRCIDRGISFVLETSMNNIDLLKKNIEKAKNNGYLVNMNLLVAKKEDSFLSIYYRYAKLIECNVGNRLTQEKFHDEGYKNITSFLSDDNTLSKLNSISIHNRNLTSIIFQEEIRGNINQLRDKSIKAINNERKRRPTFDEQKNTKEQEKFVLDCIDKGLIKTITKDDFLKKRAIKSYCCGKYSPKIFKPIAKKSNILFGKFNNPELKGGRRHFKCNNDSAQVKQCLKQIDEK